MSVLVATANVKNSLPAAQARASLEVVLSQDPDLIGLQEWGFGRFRLLRASGHVHLVGRFTIPLVPHLADDYHWFQPLLGGCVIGARSSRYRVVSARQHRASWPGRSDVPGAWMGLEEPRVATSARLQDRETGQDVTLIDYHLVPGVQTTAFTYQPGRPRQVARHRLNIERLQRLIDHELGEGRTVYAVGDSNFAGLALRGLTSAWVGDDLPGGTLGARTIDDVFGPGPVARVWTMETPSDHRAVFTIR